MTKLNSETIKADGRASSSSETVESLPSSSPSEVEGKKRRFDDLACDDDASSSNNEKKTTSGAATSQQPQPRKQRRPRKAPHELLTDEEKKANHIASEQKRRQNIRLGFEQLIEVVPSLSQGNRSEALILQKSVEHIRHLVSMKDELKGQVRALQERLGDSIYDEDSSDDELAYGTLGR
ncbi:hypothetical protein BX666DRAFT_1957010 [Dichotomocladium elegans]|nr:hypothetical protein BX666DRAFT_1957010 [Dichotomocladium elegans]